MATKRPKHVGSATKRHVRELLMTLTPEQARRLRAQWAFEAEERDPIRRLARAIAARKRSSGGKT